MHLFYEKNSRKIYITIGYKHTKNSQIENLNSLNYNYQSLDSTCDKICFGNGRFYHFNYDGKLDLCYIFKRRYPGM